MSSSYKQHFWEMVYIAALHGTLTRAAVGSDMAAQLAKGHADAAAKELDKRIELIERMERSKPRDAGS